MLPRLCITCFNYLNRFWTSQSFFPITIFCSEADLHIKSHLKLKDFFLLVHFFFLLIRQTGYCLPLWALRIMALAVLCCNVMQRSTAGSLCCRRWFPAFEWDIVHIVQKHPVIQIHWCIICHSQLLSLVLLSVLLSFLFKFFLFISIAEDAGCIYGIKSPFCALLSMVLSIGQLDPLLLSGVSKWTLWLRKAEQRTGDCKVGSVPNEEYAHSHPHCFIWRPGLTVGWRNHTSMDEPIHMPPLSHILSFQDSTNTAG